MRIGTVLMAAACVVCFPLAAVAQPNWCDNFDSYAAGSGLHGQGGWHGWDGSIAADAYVSNLYSRSAPHSAEIRPTSDIVHEYVGYTAGVWTYTAWQYVPTGSTGEQYFLLLNTYNDFGPYNWSTQVRFGNGLVISDPEGLALPLITGQWVEIRVVIDLGADLQSFYYNGALLSQKSWTQGVSGGGAVAIACVDLFGNGASPIYYDDLCLEGAPEPTGACCTSTGCAITTASACSGTYMGDGTDCDPDPCAPVPTENTTWGRVKAIYAR